MPFGFHLLNYRTTKEGFTYELEDPGLTKISDLGETGLGVDFDLMNRVWCPKRIAIEKTDQNYVQRLVEVK